MTTTPQEVVELARTLAPTFLPDARLQDILMTLPAGLVAICDGEFDADEKRFVYSMCLSLVEDAGDEEARQFEVAETYSVLLALLHRKSDIEAKLFDAMRSEIARDVDFGPLLVSMLQGVAECSEGVSPQESAEIERIHLALGIH